MISFDKAQSIVASGFSSLVPRTEFVPLASSINRILAEDVIADTNLPPFDSSAVDGYAVCYTSAVRSWKIIGEVAAGRSSDLVLNENSAAAIMTGARLPSGADTVIALEGVTVQGDTVTLQENFIVRSGAQVRIQGSDLRSGTLAIPKYSKIRPAMIALLAACGKHRPLVFQPLRAGLLSTGDELVDVATVPSGDKIRVTNSSAIAAASQEAHMETIDLGLVGDRATQLKERIVAALNNESIDILMTTGGVSVGRYDIVRDVLKDAGVEILFWKVRMRPGRPLLFGVYRRKETVVPVFGLPGNPVSAFAAFMLFVKPNCAHVFHQPAPPPIVADIQAGFVNQDEMRHFLRGTLEYCPKERRYMVAPVHSQSSGSMTALCAANCLIVIPESTPQVQKGDPVECIPI
jgi:molybdopterin molybdotransferase